MKTAAIVGMALPLIVLLSVGCSGTDDVSAPPATVNDGKKEVTLRLHGEDGISVVYQPCLAFGPPAAPQGLSVAAETIPPISLGRFAVGDPISVRQAFGQQLDAWNGYAQTCYFTASLDFEATIGGVSSSCNTPDRSTPPTSLQCTVSIDTTVPVGNQVPP